MSLCFSLKLPTLSVPDQWFPSWLFGPRSSCSEVQMPEVIHQWRFLTALKRSG